MVGLTLIKSTHLERPSTDTFTFVFEFFFPTSPTTTERLKQYFRHTKTHFNAENTRILVVRWWNYRGNFTRLYLCIKDIQFLFHCIFGIENVQHTCSLIRWDFIFSSSLLSSTFLNFSWSSCCLATYSPYWLIPSMISLRVSAVSSL